MESVIREGALRLLMMNDTACDVIISCPGHRLMAHKLILSMASPVFRALLLEDCSDSTVIIFPEVPAATVSLILEYIYTGSVMVCSDSITDFLGLANFLQIYVDVDCKRSSIFSSKEMPKYREHFVEKTEDKSSVSDGGKGVSMRAADRKIPDLLPIAKIRPGTKVKDGKKLFSYILPSPWCPRTVGVYGDPKTDCLEPEDAQIASNPNTPELLQNDTNNNLEAHHFSNYFKPSKPPERGRETETVLHQRLPEMYSIGSRPSSFTERLFRTRCRPPTNAHGRPKGLNLKLLDSSENSNSNLTTPLRRLSLKPNQEHVGDVERSRDSLNFSSPDLPRSPLLEKILEGPFKCETLSKESSGLSESSSENSRENLDQTLSGSRELAEGKRKEKELKREKPYKCEECGKCFSQMRNYKYHRSVHEGTKEFAAKCPECGKMFNDKGYLSSHMKIHRDKKEYACPHCPKRFNQRVAYNMHLRIHTGIKPHECSTCGKSFSRKMLLKQHQRVHTGERPYSCPECGKTFADRSNMSLHARLHTGIKPYACGLCSKSFTKKHHLKTHMNFHTGLKPYSCDKCGLAFSQSSNMRTHFKKCLLKDGGKYDPSGSVQYEEENT